MTKGSDNPFPSVLAAEQGSAPAGPSAGQQRLYIDSSDHHLKRVDSSDSVVDIELAAGGAPADYAYAGFGSDVTLSAEVSLLAFQLCNEIKGWPPIVNTGDLDALNLWWDKVGTPSTAPSVVAVSGEGITETYELALKVVTDAASEGLSQRWTYADEPRVKAGRTLSALLAIWSVSSLSVTAKLVSSDASETAASAVTAAGWTLVEIPAHTLAGTYCDLQVTAGDAGTFYVVPLGACIGTRGLALAPRGLRYISTARAALVNAIDPGGADYADVDATASASPLTVRLQLEASYTNGSATGRQVKIRRNGRTDDDVLTAQVAVAGVSARNYGPVDTDDGQIFEYKTGSAAGETESVTITLLGYWEWE